MTNLYFQIPNLKGDSGSTSFSGANGWSTTSSFTWGESNGGTNDKPGKAVPSSIVLTRSSGYNSPYYMYLCGSGKVLGTVNVILTATYSNKEEIVYEYELSNAFISAYQLEGEAGSTPFESISFVFERMTSIFHPINADGSQGTTQTHYWDFLENAGE